MTEILRKKRVLDDSIISHKYNHGDNRVVYYIYLSDGEEDTPDRLNIPTLEEAKKLSCAHSTGKDDNAAWCFSDIPSAVSNIYKNRKEDLKKVRIYYPVELDKNQPKLTAEETTRWIELCKTHGYLPSYVNIGECVKFDKLSPTFVFKAVGDAGEPLVLSVLYVYLCITRFFREDVGVIKSVIYLTDKEGMDFDSALVLASKICTNYTVHHFIQSVRQYGGAEVNKAKDIELAQLVGLKLFLKDPSKYDSTTTATGNRFNTMNYIYNAGQVYTSRKCTAQELFDPLLQERPKS
jgi:hypothetical protein